MDLKSVLKPTFFNTGINTHNLNEINKQVASDWKSWAEGVFVHNHTVFPGGQDLSPRQRTIIVRYFSSS